MNSLSIRNLDYLPKRYIQVAYRQYSSEHRAKKEIKNGFVNRPNENNIDYDYIGPPDKLSNLRPVAMHISKDETPLEKTLRLKRIEAEKWNQQFWANHNQKFVKQREEFSTKNRADDNETISADKMSEFYKKFLDENWRSHVSYNKEWYIKNFELLLLSFRCKFQLEKLLKYLKK